MICFKHLTKREGKGCRESIFEFFAQKSASSDLISRRGNTQAKWFIRFFIYGIGEGTTSGLSDKIKLFGDFQR